MPGLGEGQEDSGVQAGLSRAQLYTLQMLHPDNLVFTGGPGGAE